jgi:hypothetical protein
MAEWKLKRGEQEWPIRDAEMLREWASSGRLNPDDYVFNPVLAKWVYARDVAELAGLMDPNRRRCPFCKQYTVTRVKGLQGGENLTGCILACLFLLPLLLYYIGVTGKLYCTNCKRRVPSGAATDSL